MIICEREDTFMMVAQHHHAQISGEIAQNWRDGDFYGLEKKEEVVLATYEHDRGWIELDASPLWNDDKQKPYSFMDYPLAQKIAYYKKGINEAEKISKYAGLLCSLHYVSFLKNEIDPIGKKFVEEELKRQRYLFEVCGIEQQVVRNHLAILKFCDNLSLYICLNEPGVDKENEHPFYRNGIPTSLPFAKGESIQVQWADQETVSLSISPLDKELEVNLVSKEIKKGDIKAYGLEKAYAMTSFSSRRVFIRLRINIKDDD